MSPQPDNPQAVSTKKPELYHWLPLMPLGIIPLGILAAVIPHAFFLSVLFAAGLFVAPYAMVSVPDSSQWSGARHLENGPLLAVLHWAVVLVVYFAATKKQTMQGAVITWCLLSAGSVIAAYAILFYLGYQVKMGLFF